LIDAVEPDIMWVSDIELNKEAAVLKSGWVEG
jgi:hypothetical protein